MCYLCRSNLTTEEIIAQLKQNIDYNKFNTASVMFILHSCIGIDGPEAKQIALELLNNFIKYVNTKYPYYTPETGSEAMLHPNVLVNLHKWCEEFTNTNSLSDNQLFELLGRKIHEFQKKQANRELGIGIGFTTGLALILGVMYYKYKK